MTALGSETRREEINRNCSPAKSNQLSYSLSLSTRGPEAREIIGLRKEAEVDRALRRMLSSANRSELRRFNSSIRHIAPTAKHDGLTNWFPVSFSKFWFWFLLLLSPKNTEIKSENDSLVLKNVKSTVNKT